MKKVNIAWMLAWMLTMVGQHAFAQNNPYTVSKFDFVPGEKVIFYDDFQGEAIGDYPALWLTNGSGEIVTAAQYPGRWFQLTKSGYHMPDIQGDLTENYTIEFDLVPLNNIQQETVTGLNLFLLSGSRTEPGYGAQPGVAGLRLIPGYDNVSWNNWSEAREWAGDAGQAAFTFKSEEKYHISIWVQKQRFRLYANENKVLDLPRGLQANYLYNIFRIENSDECQPLIANFRVAAGASDLRNKLLTDGKFISYGIQFDVNSDKLKPESAATLKMIADLLKENATMRMLIVGHTDADGDNASNLDLSKRRATAVKNELAKAYAIDAARLDTDGKGEAEPLVPNDNALHKSQNRRVEFTKR